MTELCALAYKYTTDKCPQILHTYTPFYCEFFMPLRWKAKKIVEMGIGGAHYRNKIGSKIVGGSLKMWRDFFPKAEVFGLDYDRTTMFTDERIKTFRCNQRIDEEVQAVIKSIGPDIDIFIDDGSHRTSDQIALCKAVMPLLPKNAIYVIEDADLDPKHFKELAEYNWYVPRLAPLDKARNRRNHLIVLIK